MKIEKHIENFTLKEFFAQPRELIDKYVVMFQYLPPLVTEKQLKDMTFGDVEGIKQAINKGGDLDLLNSVAEMEGTTVEKLLNYDIITFFKKVSSLKEQLTKIANAETRLAPEFPNVKFEKAGGSEKMAKFGVYNTLEMLSGGDVTKYDFILNMKYSEVFTILLMKKTNNDIQHQMSQMKD